MKIRQSFVSNSSSTSYVIAHIKDESEECPLCKHKVENLPTIFAHCNRFDDEDTYIKCGNYEDYLEAWTNPGWDSGDWSVEPLNRLEKYKNNKLYTLSISYHNQCIKRSLQENVKAGNIVIIYSGEDWHG